MTEEQWHEVQSRLPVGTDVVGTVTHKAPLGVYVKLDAIPYEHAAQLDVTRFCLAESPDDPVDYPEVGSRIQAKIAYYSIEIGKISLTQIASAQQSKDAEKRGINHVLPHVKEYVAYDQRRANMIRRRIAAAENDLLTADQHKAAMIRQQIEAARKELAHFEAIIATRQFWVEEYESRLRELSD